jgi:hypothetical protein
MQSDEGGGGGGGGGGLDRRTHDDQAGQEHKEPSKAAASMRKFGQASLSRAAFGFSPPARDCDAVVVPRAVLVNLPDESV